MTVNHLAEFQRARRDPDLVVVPGFHALKHAVRFGATVVRAVTTDPAVVERLTEELAPDLRDKLPQLLEPVTEATFAKLGRNPPSTGVLALARRPAVDVPAVLQAPAPSPVVFLENPRGLGNIGAVIRVAAAVGAAGVLCQGQPDPWDPAAVRGAAGLQFALPVAKVSSLPAGGRPLVALDPEGEPLPEVTLPGHAVLAFGAERRGLSRGILDRADRRVRIPMRAGVSSLNLATSVSAVLFGAAFAPA